MNWIFVLVLVVSFPSKGRGYNIETKDMIERFRFLEGEIKSVKQSNDVLTHDISALKRDNYILKRDNDMLKQDIGVLKRDNGVLKLNDGVLKQNIRVLKGNQDNLKREIDVLKGNQDDLKRDIDVLKENQDVLKREIGVLKRTNDILTQNNDMLKQNFSVIIMNEKKIMKEDFVILNQNLVNKSNGEGNLQTELDAIQAKLHGAAILPDSQQTFSSQKRLLESGVSGQSSNKIAFSAALTHSVTLGYHQTIEYDKVLTNIGNAYDTTDGHFTVPTKGLYLLSATIFNEYTDVQPIEMVKNGIQICALYSHSNSHSHMSSQTIVVVLELNDKVWVRRFRDHSSATLFGTPNQPYNTFSGVLLFEM